MRAPKRLRREACLRVDARILAALDGEEWLTTREIATAADVSPRTAWDVLRRAERDGVVTSRPTTPAPRSPREWARGDV